MFLDGTRSFLTVEASWVVVVVEAAPVVELVCEEKRVCEQRVAISNVDLTNQCLLTVEVSWFVVVVEATPVAEVV